VLGFAADALALVGIAVLAAPAAWRIARRRPGTADFGLSLLGLVAMAAFAVFVVTLVRFPQRDGDPIKSSYLLYTAPCWAILSVGAWARIRARRPRVGRVLVAVAILYVASYAVDVGAALTRLAPVGNLGELRNVVDLKSYFQKTSPNPGIGGPVQFLVGVNSNGSQDATGVVLTIGLSPQMKLLGQPFSVQGSCGETVPVRCDLGEIPGGGTTYIRFSVAVNAGGPQTLTADVTSDQRDFNPSDNTSSYTINLGPP
jgi:hypothetical protein